MEEEYLKRWRLILGGNEADGTGITLTQEEQRIDQSLEAVYDSDRRGGLGSSAPKVSRWLGDIREFFPQTVVQVIQRDAIKRLNITSLLTEKEMLELMKQALEPVHEKLTVLDTKMTSLDEKVNSLDAKVTSLDEKVNSLDTKVASLDAKVNSLDTKVASLDAKVNSLDADVRGIKVVLENEVRRDLNLLAEGHAAILERLPSQEEKEALEARMDAMEAAIRLHSKQIRELKKAQ